MVDTFDAKTDWVARVLGLRIPAAPRRDGAPAGRREQEGVRLAKALIEWNGARIAVGKQVAKLQRAILAQAADEPDFAMIKSNIGNLDALLESLDDDLSVKLGEIRGTSDPAEKAVFSRQAAAIVSRLETHVAQDSLIADIDDNGIVDLDIGIKATVTAALGAVRAAI